VVVRGQVENEQRGREGARKKERKETSECVWWGREGVAARWMRSRQNFNAEWPRHVEKNTAASQWWWFSRGKVGGSCDGRSRQVVGG
jgi:hypothetical protein